jgi:phage recombination protein Bet
LCKIKVRYGGPLFGVFMESNNSVALKSAWTTDQLRLIKNQIAKDATNDELELFLYHCKKTGLDPLAHQIYFQKRLDRKTGESRVVFITSIDGFRTIAARTGEHAGTDDAIFELDLNNNPKRATVTVYRLVKGQKGSFTASARWEEYCPPQGKDFMWQKMKFTMLAKCAESLALRKAFPNELGGTYSKEELDQSPAEDKSPPEPPVPPKQPDPVANPADAMFTEEEREYAQSLSSLSEQENNKPPTCEACGTELRLTKKRDAFNCPNWKDTGAGRHSYVKI